MVINKQVISVFQEDEGKSLEKECGKMDRLNRAQIIALQFISCVPLGKLFNIFESKIPLCQIKTVLPLLVVVIRVKGNSEKSPASG